MDSTQQPKAPEQAAPQAPAPKKSAMRTVWEFVRFALTVAIVVLGVRLFVAQPFIVSGASMVPTFQDKNYLIIDELTYRFREPHRGDVIVFRPPFNESTYYIKRIIGLPGETVSVENGIVTIVNAEHPDGMTLSETYVAADEGEDHAVTVPEGQYFVMGDNRPASYDSRKWGTLPKENIIGRALFRLYPFDAIAVLPGEHVQY